MPITIDEVIDRANEGQTRPFLCRGEGRSFYVKGRSVPRRELVSELLAANIASRLGLRIAPYEVAYVPDQLVESKMGHWLADLGAGPCFASERVSAAGFTINHLSLVPPEVRQLIGAFDWWVRNMDRTLTAHGGNPNMLWRPTNRGAGEVVVIDHNLAFDTAFSPEDFLQTHVFAQDLKALVSDYLLRDHIRASFRASIADFEDLLANIPLEWSFTDAEQTVPAPWLPEHFRAILDRCCDDELWNFDP